MTTKLTVVVPEISTDQISNDLRALTEMLVKSGVDNDSGGFLGGGYGYGVEYSNAVFTMFPYWWDDCDCGHEDAKWAFEDSNSHTNFCFQTLMHQAEDKAFKSGEKFDAKEYGLDRGINNPREYCTCQAHELATEWYSTHYHLATCSEELPNFVHHVSGLEVRWYKYIGRGMELSNDISITEWIAIYSDCLNSVLATASEGFAS